MSENKNIIGERLYFLRKKKKKPVEQITTPLNIARSTYTNWERGFRAPNWEHLVQLAHVFNTTTDFLMGKTDDELISNEVTEKLKEDLISGKYTHDGEPITKEQAEQIDALLKIILMKS